MIGLVVAAAVAYKYAQRQCQGKELPLEDQLQRLSGAAKAALSGARAGAREGFKRPGTYDLGQLFDEED